nr:sugar transporter stl1 [Quercus suber]
MCELTNARPRRLHRSSRASACQMLPCLDRCWSRAHLLSNLSVAQQGNDAPEVVRSAESHPINSGQGDEIKSAGTDMSLFLYCTNLAEMCPFGAYGRTVVEDVSDALLSNICIYHQFMMSSLKVKENRYFGLRGGWLTFWITVACGTDMTLFGYDQGVFGGVIVTDNFLTTLGVVGDTSLQGTITAIYDVGCFFGAIAAYFIGDWLGRKKTILLGTTILSIGAILQITSYSVAQMIVGRIVAGVGNGINTSTAPPWQAETSKAAWRGKLIVIELILNIAGFSLSTWVTYGFSFIPGPVAWRIPLALQFIFIVILFATVPWLPESPRWLVNKGHYEEAELILADIEGTEVEDPFVQTELSEIKFAADYEKTHQTRIRDLVRGKAGAEGGTHALRRIFLGMGAQAMQQLSGINVTSYYLPTVLISVGFTNSMARLLAACNSVSYLVFSLIGIPNVERWVSASDPKKSANA